MLRAQALAEVCSLPGLVSLHLTRKQLLPGSHQALRLLGPRLRKLTLTWVSVSDACLVRAETGGAGLGCLGLSRGPDVLPAPNPEPPSQQLIFPPSFKTPFAVIGRDGPGAGRAAPGHV